MPLRNYGPGETRENMGHEHRAEETLHPFSLKALEQLLLEGLNRAGAKETSARILIHVESYGGAGMTMGLWDSWQTCLGWGR